MKLKNMFLCDAATPHPDNTFSVLRGGINRWKLPVVKRGPDSAQQISSPPIKLALVATIELELTEMGRLHNLEVALLDLDGKRVIPKLMSNFQTPISQRRGYHNIILDMFIKVNNPGEYCFYINVDGHELGTVPFYVVHQDTK